MGEKWSPDRKIIEVKVKTGFIWFISKKTMLVHVYLFVVTVYQKSRNNWFRRGSVWGFWEGEKTWGPSFKWRDWHLIQLSHFQKYSIMLRECIAIIVLYVLILIVGLKKRINSAEEDLVKVNICLKVSDCFLLLFWFWIHDFFVLCIL